MNSSTNATGLSNLELLNKELQKKELKIKALQKDNKAILERNIVCQEKLNRYIATVKRDLAIEIFQKTNQRGECSVEGAQQVQKLLKETQIAVERAENSIKQKSNKTKEGALCQTCADCKCWGVLTSEDVLALISERNSMKRELEYYTGQNSISTANYELIESQKKTIGELEDLVRSMKREMQLKKIKTYDN